ncbi:MAG: rhodanese-like domain-containing protein [Actinomycetota bacterium]|nr:rhodanese-like domain-containing protein [Actinomycetota bacterium]
MTRTITASELGTALLDENELAIIDARDHESYSRGHLLWAANMRAADANSTAPILVPRRSTRVVVMDNGGDEADHLRRILSAEGWTNVSVLDGGIKSWSDAGYELYSGVSVPSKLFGELVERHYGTPHVSATELRQWMEQERPLTILDSRTEREFQRMSIPTARSCPGGELVHRAFDLVDADATIVVNCAGRTRSILGTESLIRSGIPSRVVALENGTMGWELADLTLDHGESNAAPAPTPSGRKQASLAARQVAERFNVKRVNSATVNQWRTDDARTLYLFDVRTPHEYQKGHPRGFRTAPGGQLVQNTDEYAITRGARIVLADDDLTRSTMTASWLLEMGWETYVLDEDVNEGPREVGIPELPPDIPPVVVPPNSGDADSILGTESLVRAGMPATRQAMQDYLHWEVGLVDQYDRDDLARFTSSGWA